MKKRILKIASMIIVLLMMITPISAHPGRTDANGGHYCRTNCAKWGLRDGEYHYHNGGGSSSSSSSDSSSSSSSTDSGSSSTSQTQSTPQVVYYTKQGETAGYNYKKANPDAGKEDLTGKDQTYINGYDTGFTNAENELTTLSKDQGTAKGTEDGTTTESYNLEVPVGLISSVYLDSYKDAYNQSEASDFSKIRQDANKKAIDNARNLEDEDTNSEYTLEKQKKVYKESYQSTYDQEEKEINSLKKKLSKYAQDDFDNEKQSDESYRKYKNYKVYDVLDKKYKKEYNKYKKQKEQEDENGVAGGAGVVALGIIGYVLYKRKRK